MLQDELAEKYNYKKLPRDLSRQVRLEYLRTIPDGLNLRGDLNFKILSKSGTLISNGYNRIVIGDYGAFIEFDSNQIIEDNICVQKGQEYRIIDERYSKNIKYHWFTTKDDSGIKIYYQQKTVPYADYVQGMFYISPFEIDI